MPDKCPHCDNIIHTNGSGLKKDLVHQEELGKLEHERLRNDLTKIEEKIKTSDEKVEEKIKTLDAKVEDKITGIRNKVDTHVSALHDKIGTKFQFTFRITMAILTILVIFSTASDNSLSTSITEIKHQINTDEKTIHQNEALLKAIIDGHIVLKNENYVSKDIPLMP